MSFRSFSLESSLCLMGQLSRTVGLAPACRSRFTAGDVFEIDGPHQSGFMVPATASVDVDAVFQ